MPEPQPDGGAGTRRHLVSVRDRQDGNAFSCTPSDGSNNTPIIPGVGILCSGRGTQSWADPTHPCSVAPGKRPRLTPNPALALKGGKAFMPFGTPGGDVQPQAMLQVFLNINVFGMDPQARSKRRASRPTAIRARSSRTRIIPGASISSRASTRLAGTSSRAGGTACTSGRSRPGSRARCAPSWPIPATASCTEAPIRAGRPTCWAGRPKRRERTDVSTG
jgi:hypothetical protein